MWIQNAGDVTDEKHRKERGSTAGRREDTVRRKGKDSGNDTYFSNSKIFVYLKLYIRIV